MYVPWTPSPACHAVLHDVRVIQVKVFLDGADYLRLMYSTSNVTTPPASQPHGISSLIWWHKRRALINHRPRRHIFVFCASTSSVQGDAVPRFFKPSRPVFGRPKWTCTETKVDIMVHLFLSWGEVQAVSKSGSVSIILPFCFILTTCHAVKNHLCCIEFTISLLFHTLTIIFFM